MFPAEAHQGQVLGPMPSEFSAMFQIGCPDRPQCGEVWQRQCPLPLQNRFASILAPCVSWQDALQTP